MGKNVLVLGAGGREHAIAWKISQSVSVDKVFMAPGNGVSTETIVPTGFAWDDVQKLRSFIAENEICLTVVGPEAPLAEGVVDALNDVPIFGPIKAAASLESSKVFAKEIMNAAGVPTAKSEHFTQVEPALEFLRTLQAPFVVKADGLAAGKGVIIATSLEEADAAVRECLESNKFGSAGAQILIEEFLQGREASVMAVINNEHISMLPISSDYKRIGEGGTGPNTGGMGAITPSQVISEDQLLSIRDNVFTPTISTLRERGIPYVGFLYAGLMISDDGRINVLEFNCRLGDPETQALMLRIEDDFFEVLNNAVNEPSLLPDVVRCNDDTILNVVLASKGYPGSVEDGKVISGIESAESTGAFVFQAGTKQSDGNLLSKGGRILSVAAKGSGFEEVQKKVYAAIENVSFEGMQYRRDIGS